VEVLARTITFNGHAAKLALSNDITARKMAEDRVHEQATLLNLAHDAIFAQDLEGRIKFWNKGAETLYGWSSADAVDKTTAELFPTGKPGPLEAARRELLSKGEWNGELNRQTRDGRKVIIESRWTLLRDEQGHPQSILVIEADITEKKNWRPSSSALKEWKASARWRRAWRMISTIFWLPSSFLQEPCVGT